MDQAIDKREMALWITFFPRSVKTLRRTLVHLQKWPCLWPMTLKFNRVLEVVEVHVRTELYQAECSGSRITSFLPYLAMGKNLLIRSCDLDPWPWKSIGFVLLSRYMFMQNFIQLSAVVHESSYVQRKKNKKHNCPPSLPQTVINKSEKYDRNFFLLSSRLLWVQWVWVRVMRVRVTRIQVLINKD